MKYNSYHGKYTDHKMCEKDITEYKTLDWDISKHLWDAEVK